MKKLFNLETLDEQLRNILTKILIKLREFDELRDCYIEGMDIKLKKGPHTLNICSLLFSPSDISFRIYTNYESSWSNLDLNVYDVFENGIHTTSSVMIKEPTFHQANKEKLENLSEGNGYYLFDTNYKINEESITDIECYKYFTITCDNYDEFQNIIKYARNLIAISEEEIKNKTII